jgi:hypothetical protein
MILQRPFRSFVSAKFTVALLCVVALLLLLNVMLPQAAVLGEERYAAVVEQSGPFARFVLDGLGFGRMATSPVFLAVLGLFFLNLALVLLVRLGPTWRRIALRSRSEHGLQAWARLEESLAAPLPEDWSAGEVARTLRGFGYQVRRPGERTYWAVKHRTAPLGFLLFHLSFLLLCAGGTLIFYTRFVGSAVLSEGQQFSGEYASVERQRPAGGSPELSFSLERADPRFERGEPVHLSAVFRFQQPGGSFERTARVNHPARWGTTSLLVNRAGLAPVLWLQDANGFTLDRVVVPVRTRGKQPTEIELGGGALRAFLHPLGDDAPFPAREEFSRTAMRFQLTRESVVVFDGLLRPGEAATLDRGRLVQEELRYWVGVRIVSERGGGLLIAGFVAGVVGLIWRLLWYRREVALTWDERSFRLVGRSEFFSTRFREELRSIFSTLGGPSEDPHSRSEATAGRGTGDDHG